MRFNDGKCDALGRFWAGTINEAQGPRQRRALLPRCARRPGSPALHADGQRGHHRQRPGLLDRCPHRSTGPTPPRTRCAPGTGTPRPTRCRSERVFQQLRAPSPPAGRPSPPLRYDGRPRRRHRRRARPLLGGDVRGRSCCASRPRARVSRRWRLRCSARPCPASAATTCARSSSPAAAKGRPATPNSSERPAFGQRDPHARRYARACRCTSSRTELGSPAHPADPVPADLRGGGAAAPRGPRGR